MKAILRWYRSPSGETVLACFLWVMVVDTLCECLITVHDRYQAVKRTEEARMYCEARGGLYGSQGSEAPDCLGGFDAAKEARR